MLGILKMSKLSPVMDKLILAKKMSDQRRYKDKSQLLTELMTKYPTQWCVDSDRDKSICGVTHVPTGFKYHLPRKHIPIAVAKK